MYPMFYVSGKNVMELDIIGVIEYKINKLDKNGIRCVVDINDKEFYVLVGIKVKGCEILNFEINKILRDLREINRNFKVRFVEEFGIK